MIKMRILLLLVFLYPVIVSSQVSSGEPPEMLIEQAPTQTLDALHQLIDEILIADPERIYSVQMRLDRAVRLEDLREAAIHLDIPRVFAFIGDSTPTNPGYSPIVVFGLGTIYERAGAWQREICKAQVYSTYDQTRLIETVPPEDWPVVEIHVYGSAHAVRELRRGAILPPASLIEGSAAGHPRAPEGMIAYETQQIAKKIEVPANYVPSLECRRYVTELDAPILSGNPIFPSREDAGKDPAELLRQQLSERASDVAVTLALDFNQQMNVEAFALFVEQHQIDGLNAELSPISNDRVSVDAQLSIHGAPLRDKIRRARCMMDLGKDKVPVAADDWYASRAQVSVPVKKAWQIISDQKVYSARLVADFAPEQILRLESYYRRQATDVIRIPPSMQTPRGCGQFFRLEE